MSLSPEEQEQKRASEAIDRRIRVELKDYENTIKILLLGLCNVSIVHTSWLCEESGIR